MDGEGNSFRGCLPTQPLTLAERQKFCRCVTSNGPFSEQIADGNSRRSSTSSLDFIFFACEPRRRDSSQRSRRSTTFEYDGLPLARERWLRTCTTYVHLRTSISSPSKLGERRSQRERERERGRERESFERRTQCIFTLYQIRLAINNSVFNLGTSLAILLKSNDTLEGRKESRVVRSAPYFRLLWPTI